MSDLGLARTQVRYRNKAFWRNPASAFFTFAFPLMFLVIFTGLFGSGKVPVNGEMVSTSTFYVPAISVFAVVSACYTYIAMSIVFARETGVLKRLRGTPLPSWTYLAAQIVHAVFVAVLLVAICAAFGAAFYEAEIPNETLPEFIVTLVLGSACFCSLALAISAAVPSMDSAPALINASILPLLFISNVFIPLPADPPAWMDVTSQIFPVRHFAEAMLDTYFPRTVNAGVDVLDLAVMAAWTIAGIVLAMRFFRWEPKHQ